MNRTPEFEEKTYRPLSFLCGLLLLAGCASSPRNHSLERFEFEQPEMGVPFRIVLYATGSERAETAAKAAFKRIEQLNAIMSDYETDSELSLLSRSSEEGAPAVRVSDDLWAVLSASQEFAEESEGAFDITVGPCVALWRKARREHELPDSTRLENARAKVGFRNLRLDKANQTAQLVRRGMRLDLGGIAKGYAADEARKTLASFGIARALVAASGDLSVGDAPPGQKGWRIEIAGYEDPGGPPSAVLLLDNCGVSTSGDLFQRVEINGIRYSHILDPFTCIGMTNHALATVIAKTCTTSDVLATACTILEKSKAITLAARYDAAVRIVTLTDRKLLVSQNKHFEKVVRLKSVAKPVEN